MDAVEHAVGEPKRIADGDGSGNLAKYYKSGYQPLCFDLWDSKITTFVPMLSSSPPTAFPLHTSDRLKALGLHVLKRARAQRTHSPVSELELGDEAKLELDDEDKVKVVGNSKVVDFTEDNSFEGDLESEFDASICDFEGIEEEEEECGDEVFFEESVRNKMEFLAEMVGMDSGCGSSVVLNQVVRVLKELERKAGEKMGAQNVIRIL